MLTKRSMTGLAGLSSPSPSPPSSSEVEERWRVVEDRMKSSWALMGGERNLWSWVCREG